MKLGRLEWWLMNNPLRPLFQKYLETPQLLSMGGAQPNARVLEIGCGSGAGIDSLFDSFGASRVHGFDIDPRMVRLAANRHQRQQDKVQVWVGNVGAIPTGHDTYDAVFDFGVLHHVMDWPSALAEIHRVLKPGGRFYIEEITRSFIVHPVWRRLLNHPQGNRFDRNDLVHALRRTGFSVRCSREVAGLFIWCAADKTPA